MYKRILILVLTVSSHCFSMPCKDSVKSEIPENLSAPAFSVNLSTESSSNGSVKVKKCQLSKDSRTLPSANESPILQAFPYTPPSANGRRILQAFPYTPPSANGRRILPAFSYTSPSANERRILPAFSYTSPSANEEIVKPTSENNHVSSLTDENVPLSSICWNLYETHLDQMFAELSGIYDRYVAKMKGQRIFPNNFFEFSIKTLPSRISDIVGKYSNSFSQKQMSLIMNFLVRHSICGYTDTRYFNPDSSFSCILGKLEDSHQKMQLTLLRKQLGKAFRGIWLEAMGKDLKCYGDCCTLDEMRRFGYLQNFVNGKIVEDPFFYWNLKGLSNHDLFCKIYRSVHYGRPQYFSPKIGINPMYSDNVPQEIIGLNFYILLSNCSVSFNSPSEFEKLMIFKNPIYWLYHTDLDNYKTEERAYYYNSSSSFFEDCNIKLKHLVLWGELEDIIYLSKKCPFWAKYELENQKSSNKQVLVKGSNERPSKKASTDLKVKECPPTLERPSKKARTDLKVKECSPALERPSKKARTDLKVKECPPALERPSKKARTDLKVKECPPALMTWYNKTDIFKDTIAGIGRSHFELFAKSMFLKFLLLSLSSQKDYNMRVKICFSYLAPDFPCIKQEDWEGVDKYVNIFEINPMEFCLCSNKILNTCAAYLKDYIKVRSLNVPRVGKRFFDDVLSVTDFDFDKFFLNVLDVNNNEGFQAAGERFLANEDLQKIVNKMTESVMQRVISVLGDLSFENQYVPPTFIYVIYKLSQRFEQTKGILFKHDCYKDESQNIKILSESFEALGIVLKTFGTVSRDEAIKELFLFLLDPADFAKLSFSELCKFSAMLVKYDSMRLFNFFKFFRYEQDKINAYYQILSLLSTTDRSGNPLVVGEADYGINIRNVDGNMQFSFLNLLAMNLESNYSDFWNGIKDEIICRRMVDENFWVMCKNMISVLYVSDSVRKLVDMELQSAKEWWNGIKLVNFSLETILFLELDRSLNIKRGKLLHFILDNSMRKDNFIEKLKTWPVLVKMLIEKYVEAIRCHEGNLLQNRELIPDFSIDALSDNELTLILYDLLIDGGAFKKLTA